MNTLWRGSVGADVVAWQRVLGVAADGVFGPATEAATKAWQEEHGLGANGVVGPETWAAAGVVDAPWIDLLDVSAAQGRIDFQRVAAAKVAPGVDRCWRGVICKVSENETWRDQTRAANIAGARAAGMLFGAYAFIHPMGDIAKQVENAWNAVGDTMPSFALALDVEAADPSLTSQQIVDQILRGRDEVQRWFGRSPLVYSYNDFWDRRVMPAARGCAELAELRPWWAWYGDGRPWYPTRAQLPQAREPWRSAKRRIELWQYSGNTENVPGAWTGHVDGINGDVDRNVYTGTEDEFAYDFCGRPRPDQLEPEPAIIRPPIEFPPRD